jgi:anti-anti-sigma factor
VSRFLVSDDVAHLDVVIERSHGRAVLSLSGELDMSSRERFVDAVQSEGVGDVVVDLGGLVFMDCRGYGGLVQARHSVSAMTIRNEVGQPAALIALIRAMEAGR